MADTCGAKTRNGGMCKKPTLKGKTRCKLHGGKSTGAIDAARPNNKNAMQHGIYSDLIHADDIKHCDSILALSGIDNELLIARLQLRRALAAQAHADTLPDGLEVYETVDRDGAENAVARSEVKHKLRDYPAIIDKLMARIESLEKTRAVLNADNHGAATDDITRDDTTIAPDEPIPDAPIL